MLTWNLIADTAAHEAMLKLSITFGIYITTHQDWSKVVTRERVAELILGVKCNFHFIKT